MKKLIFLSLIFIFSCTREEEALLPLESNESQTFGYWLKKIYLPKTPYDYVTFPKGIAVSLKDNAVNNPITNAGATLGRVLFYDKDLSKNRTVSCASCHKQKNAFSDVVNLSKGFNGEFTNRNSMPLINLRLNRESGKFFWDLRATSLENQVLLPLQDKVEMGMTLEDVVSRIKAKRYYRQLFYKAFGSSEINSERVSRSLAQFIHSIFSYSSRYDEGLAMSEFSTSNFPNFTPQENQGKRVFLNNCSSCHEDTKFTLLGHNGTSNGLDEESSIKDLGVGGVNGIPSNFGKFQSPNLRNIQLTAPYMHDGRFKTLEEVVEFYSSGIKQHPNLDMGIRFAIGNGKGFNFSTEEKSNLVAFLKTLTDTNLTNNPKWSDPFIRN